MSINPFHKNDEPCEYGPVEIDFDAGDPDVGDPGVGWYGFIRCSMCGWICDDLGERDQATADELIRAMLAADVASAVVDVWQRELEEREEPAPKRDIRALEMGSGVIVKVSFGTLVLPLWGDYDEELGESFTDVVDCISAVCCDDGTARVCFHDAEGGTSESFVVGTWEPAPAGTPVPPVKLF